MEPGRQQSTVVVRGWSRGCRWIVEEVGDPNELVAELFEHARAIFEADRRYFEALLHDGRAGAGRRENCVCSARSWQL